MTDYALVRTGRGNYGWYDARGHDSRVGRLDRLACRLAGQLPVDQTFYAFLSRFELLFVKGNTQKIRTLGKRHQDDRPRIDLPAVGEDGPSQSLDQFPFRLARAATTAADATTWKKRIAPPQAERTTV